MNRISIIRKALHLDTELWKDLPDALIEIAFRPSTFIIKKELNKLLIDKYGISHLESLEFIGDAVFELAATQIILDSFMPNKPWGTPGYMTKKREELVRNTALFCLMNRLNLCGLTAKTGKPYKIKDCADILEAIIGMLYYYLIYIKKTPDYMLILQDYIEDHLYDEDVQRNLFENNIPIDRCIIEGESEKTAFELGKEYVIGKVTGPKITSPKITHVHKQRLPKKTIYYKEPSR